jgi:hypothetical protein
MSRYSLKGFTIPQRQIIKSTARYRVVIAGRRFGKTVLGINECLLELQMGYKRLVWYIAPTYKMAKELVWEELVDSIPPHMILKKNESELSIVLRGSRSKIVLKGADNPDSLRGKGLNFVVFDEFADISEETWFKVIFPALADRKGKALFIGTPKGYNWAYDLFVTAETSPLWAAFQFTTAEGGNVDKEELEYAMRTMSPKHFNQEFNASFETLSNRVYNYFNRKKQVDPGIEDLGAEIHVGMDFNVNPMTASLSSVCGDQLHVFDEIEIPNGNTDEMAIELHRRYPARSIIIHPDPSGKSRKTSSPVGTTDFTILREAGFEVIAANKAPLIVDRVNEVNAMCLNSKKETRLFIHPRCKGLIKGLDGLTYKEKTSLIDKKLGIDHLPDGLGYKIHNLFPINQLEMSKVKIIGV